ncbi:TIGR00730 family Rossman fold protein [Amycolatopsis decaplanina]|uniref:Cytokinin riboside 5'-monophosphate phosphoribohydrolase n=1 Tax=Amycolatopsis decaplanina DSM 44594 TaxID=1284240 RepID=M2XRI1_9PSEU|nr:TIGR00730 family Rossman fold protein [Amycolatopsis decaplanina]EME51760.1 lysine decarboxylase [Amycolatopsis decaplanina DSM 44594]
MKKRISVFCGSSTGNDPRYLHQAAAVGALLAERGVGVVYGGAGYGTMGALADAALAAGGDVIGVITRESAGGAAPHRGINQLQVVADTHARKARMFQLSQGFIALPGGAGTLEELFEVWNSADLGMHAKPIGLLDTNGYYRMLLRFTDHMVSEGFLREKCRDRLHIEVNPAALLDKVMAGLEPQNHYGKPATRPAEPGLLSGIG